MNIVARPDLLEFLLLEPGGKKSQLQCAVWVEIVSCSQKETFGSLLLSSFWRREWKSEHRRQQAGVTGQDVPP